MGLRLPALTPDQVRHTQAPLVQREAILRKVDEWLAVGLINRDAIQPILAETRVQVRDLERQLEGYAHPVYPCTDSDVLELVEFLLLGARRIGARNGFASAEAEERARASLLAEKEKLEIKLRLRKAQPVPSLAPPEQLAAPAREPVAQPRADGLTLRRGMVAFTGGATVSVLIALALEILLPLIVLALVFNLSNVASGECKIC